MTALINDTTGALIASNYVDPNTKIAVIFGTGCNAAYMETVGNIPKMKHYGMPDEQEMAINASLQDLGSPQRRLMTSPCTVRMGRFRFIRPPTSS